MEYMLLLYRVSSVLGIAVKHNGAVPLQTFNVTDENGKPNFLGSARNSFPFSAVRFGAPFPEKLLESIEDPIKLLKPEELERSSLSDAYPARYHDSPPQVSLQYPHPELGLRHFCSASIIDSCNILTTVTCLVLWSVLSLSPNDFMFAAAGAFNLSKHEKTQQWTYVKNLFMHPLYDPYTWEYDFAIVNVYDCFKFNENVNSVGLPSSGNVPTTGSCITSGWNVLYGNEMDFTKSPNELKNISANIITHHDCEKYSEDFQFDFGATVLCKDELTGIASFPELISGGIVSSPWLISAVSAARPWIDKVLGSTNDNGKRTLEENLVFGTTVK